MPMPQSQTTETPRRREKMRMEPATEKREIEEGEIQNEKKERKQRKDRKVMPIIEQKRADKRKGGMQ